MSAIGQNKNSPLPTPGVQGKSFSLGDREEDDLGNEFIYVQASGAVTAAGYVCIVSADHVAAMVSTSNDLEGGLLAVAPVAFADGDYGWMQVYGTCVVRVAASCAANVPLNATATAGQLDDDGAVSALRADGIYLTTARAASAGTAPARLNWPIMAPIPEITNLVVDAITGGDSSLDITGLSAAQGGSVTVKGGPSSTTGNAGGAANLTGGVPGATGIGGAAAVTGGIGGATSGAGGVASLTGGAGTTDANGGQAIIAGGAANGTGKAGIASVRSIVTKSQGAPTALTVTAGITAAALVGGLITTTGVTAPSIHQLPTGAAIDAELPGIAIGDSFDFTIINTGTGATTDATITVNTDVTIIGNPTIGSLTDVTIISGSGTFRARRSAAHEYVVYRIA